MTPLTHVLRKAKSRYTLGREEKINRLLFMDELRLHGSSENEIKRLVSTAEAFSQDIGMGFGIKMCGVTVMNRGKVKSTDGIELPNVEKEQEMKDNFTNEYFRRTKLVLKSKLNGRIKIMAVNTWAVSILRYAAGILKWNKNKLQEMDRKTKKFMTINIELQPRSDVARLYVSRKNRGTGLIECEDSVKSEENGLGWHIKTI